MAVDLSQGILPGLQVADQLRNSRAARESQAQADMIKLNEVNRERQQEQLEAGAAANLIRIMKGDTPDSEEGQPPTETDFGSFFQRLGEQMYKAGAPKRGQELLVQSVDFRKKESDITKADFDIQKTRLENMIKAGSYMHNALGTAENESEYQYILDTLPDDILQILGPENVQTLRDSPWSPELQGYLRERALGIKDSANLALNERRTANAETATENARRNAEALRAIGQGRLEEQRRANDIREKADGNNVGKAATPAEVNTAKAAIINTIEDFRGFSLGKDDQDSDVARALNHAAQDIVGRAKVLVDQNKGTTFDTAIEQAIMESEAAGDFNVIKETVRSGFLWRKSEEIPTDIKYRRRGTTANNPAPLPEGNSATIAGKLVKGRYYQTPMGVLKWTGTDFER